ncbi:hypothetical protein CON65_03680 [Bacillus pseudomycoides]|uniref:Excalibur calcium-binding domain-containing protein n=1 Tax=Bacillus pseudomycoides TaxID=64104 RepID=A0AA91VES6_9BACI|nr:MULTISPECIES: excalibur calcium-binding domain-containing protein [Bacillus]PEB54332.1 hypothetical protein COO03_05600 [Bacillus sp. AFS098217]PED83987.1 hypothetical protein CON65_03680 [Bacillus pseudomycoides]PEU06640.1 hypothetical protein CN524_22940 [Bacillus sp. AFS019443]
MNKKLLTFLACCTLFIGLTACSKSTEKTSTLEEQKQETEKEHKTNAGQQKAEGQKQLETQKQAEEQKKQQETTQTKQQQTAPSQGKVHFSSCKEANDAGYYDITPDSPAYSKSLDKDGDGVACEHKKSGKKH